MALIVSNLNKLLDRKCLPFRMQIEKFEIHNETAETESKKKTQWVSLANSLKFDMTSFGCCAKKKKQFLPGRLSTGVQAVNLSRFDCCLTIESENMVLLDSSVPKKTFDKSKWSRWFSLFFSFRFSRWKLFTLKQNKIVCLSSSSWRCRPQVVYNSMPFSTSKSHQIKFIIQL